MSGRITDEPIDVGRTLKAVAHPGCGAVVLFLGTVRDQSVQGPVAALEYEAYRPMAETRLRELGEEAISRWPGIRWAIHHRVGRLEVEEISLVIAVASPHREAAFSAARFLLERIKDSTPIWKLEISSAGETWVEGNPLRT